MKRRGGCCKQPHVGPACARVLTLPRLPCVQVFFTKVPPTVTQNQLIQLFTACGEVAHLELFIPWPGAKISRGCGLVEFTCSRAASAAVHSLHQQFTWPHSHSALVVEWVDRNRQSSNKASKARAGAAGGAVVVGSAGSLPGSTSLRADHQQAAAAAGFGWRSAQTGAGQVSFTSMASIPQAQLLQLQQQARSSRSCPLPQLPPGWQVVGTAQQLPAAARMGINAQWASVPSSLSSLAGSRQPQAMNMAGAAYMQQQSQLQRTDSNALTLQQQLLQQQTQRMAVCNSDASSAGTWLACPTTGGVSNTSMDLSSLASLGSVYDTTVLSGSTFSSAANSTHNSGVLHSQMGVAWDKLQQNKVMDLTSQDPNACSAASHTSPSVQYSEPMLAVSAAAAAAMAGNTSDPVLQQLLQQNVMLFQTMTPPPEEEVVSQQFMLPSSGAQQQGLQATGMMATTSSAINSGLVTGLPTYMPISQAQQMNSGAGAVYTGSALHAAQQPRQQQLWYMQQGQHTQPQSMQQQAVQQQQGESPSLVVLPLTDRQLAAMSAVLPEVPKLTGAQAWISSAAAGGLQLCLSGTYTQLQAGHTAVAMLLGRSGIDDPLAPAVVHEAAS